MANNKPFRKAMTGWTAEVKAEVQNRVWKKWIWIQENTLRA
jgi:hypothetical protein